MDEHTPNVITKNPCAAQGCIGLNRTAPLVCSDLMTAVDQRPFAANQILDLESISSKLINLVAVGAVAVEWLTQDGRRQVLGFQFRGDILNLPARDSGIRAVALTNGILYRVEKERFGKCRKRQVSYDDWESEMATDLLARMTQQTMLLGRLSAVERIAAFLSQMAWRIGVVQDSEVLVALPMSRELIADHLGLNAETVSRQLSRLRVDEIIRMPKPGLIAIIDQDRLAAMTPIAWPSISDARSSQNRSPAA